MYRFHNKFNVLVLVFVSNIGLVHCKYYDYLLSRYNGHITGRVTFKKGDVLWNKEKAKLNQTVDINDAKVTIEAKKKSTAIVQFDKDLLLTVKNKTKLELSTIRNNGEKIIKAKILYGSVFCKSGANILVETPNSLVNVTGTTFEIVVFSKRETGVRVLYGEVEIYKKGQVKLEDLTALKGEKIIVKDKQEIIFSKNSSAVQKLSDLNKKEEARLKKMDDVGYVSIFTLVDQDIDKGAALEIMNSSTEKALYARSFFATCSNKFRACPKKWGCRFYYATNKDIGFLGAFVLPAVLQKKTKAESISNTDISYSSSGSGRSRTVVRGNACFKSRVLCSNSDICLKPVN